MWYNKVCREKQLTPNYISIKINDKISQCRETIRAATHCRLNQEPKFLYVKKPRKLSANLYDIYHCYVYSEKLLMMDRGTVRNM